MVRKVIEDNNIDLNLTFYFQLGILKTTPSEQIDKTVFSIIQDNIFVNKRFCNICENERVIKYVGKKLRIYSYFQRM